MEVTPGAVFLLALLYALDRGGVLPWILLAGAVHEGGHWGAVLALGGDIRRFRLSGAGAELTPDPRRPLTWTGSFLAALAGPAANFLLAGMGMALARRGVGVRLYLLAAVSLGLGLVNLLPANWLDGGKLLELIFIRLGRGELGERLTAGCALVLGGAVTVAGLLLWYTSGGQNATLCLLGMGLLWNGRKEG